MAKWTAIKAPALPARPNDDMKAAHLQELRKQGEYFGWKEGAGPDTVVFNTGMGKDLVAVSTPIPNSPPGGPSAGAVFDRFHTREIENWIVAKSNEGAARGSGFWSVPLTVQCLRNFIGITMFMHVVKLPDKRMYWGRSFGIPWIIRTMSHERYVFIKRNLRFATSAPTKMDKKNAEYDKLWPVREVTELFEKQWWANRSQSSDISIDEQMYAHKGFCLLKTYMPNKPTKRGAKAWTAAEPKTGYVYVANLYVGKKHKDDKAEEGMAKQVVLDLAEPFAEYTRFACDRFFASVGALQQLWDEQRKYLHGTVRKGSQGFPKDLVAFGKQWKKGEWAVQHAMYGAARDAKILAWSVMDSDLVMGISSCAAGKLCIQQRQVVRDAERLSEVKTVERTGPDAWAAYNQNYNGCDVADAKRAAYGLEMKIPQRWPTTLYLKFLVDTSINNAMIVFKELSPAQFPKSGVGMNFRLELVKHLCQLDHAPNIWQTDGMPTDIHDPVRVFLENGLPASRQCVVCFGTKSAAAKQQKAMRGMAGGSKPSTQCRICKVHLCVGTAEKSCFREFHKNKKYSYMWKSAPQ